MDDDRIVYKPRPPMERKIDPYRGLIQTRLEEFPKLSAVRLFDELRASGYTGGYTQIKEYLRSVRPRPSPEPVQRFETHPSN